MKRLLFLLTILFLSNLQLCGQGPQQFEKEIKRFDALQISTGDEIIVYTGSSSVRLWENLEEDCVGNRLINTGFGGSQMSDLLYFLDRTILRFNPKEVFIYEGDNDINAGKNPEDVIITAKEIVKQLGQHRSDIKINFISAKPSPSRWQFKSQYLEFNRLLKSLCDTHEQLKYIDVWSPMINSSGRPNPAIFIADSLHMNRQGYLLWKDIICPTTDD